MAVLLLAIGGVTAGFLLSWSHLDADSVLESVSEETVEIVNPTPFTVTGSSSITVALTDVVNREVVANATGIITYVAPAGQISAGSAIAQVNDLPVIAFSGAAPLTQDVALGDSGPNFKRAQRYLADLGYLSTTVPTRADLNFGRAVTRYNTEHGRPADGPMLSTTGLAWIGDNSQSPFFPRVVVGTVVVDGTVLGSGTVVSARATVAEGETTAASAIGQQLVGQFDGVGISYLQGSGSLDPETARNLASVAPSTFVTTVGLQSPIGAVAAPSGSLIRDDDQSCFMDSEGEIQSVVVIDEQPGLVILAPEGVPAAIIANPWIRQVEPSCG